MSDFATLATCPAQDAIAFALGPFRSFVFAIAIALAMIGKIVFDRPDFQFSAKAVMSSTREPRKLDWMRLLCLARFLASHNEVEWIMWAQDIPEKYVVLGDSDWRGSDTRRSTSGTLEQLCTHPIDYDCSSQHVIALSSGEAELYPTGRAPAGVSQSVQLLAEAGLKLKLEVLTDSTANIDISTRDGSGHRKLCKRGDSR